MNRLRLQVVAGVVIGVFAACIAFTGGTIDPGWLRFFGVAVLVATGVLLTWDHFLWRLGFVQRVPNVPRSVRGTWRGTLTSHWIDPETGRPPVPKPAYLAVRQTATQIRVCLLTDQARSDSRVAAVTEVDGRASLEYLFLGVPALPFRAQSPIHHGSAVLGISGRPANRLDGAYWTDRDSKGAVTFSQRRARVAEDFEGARRLFLDPA